MNAIFGPNTHRVLAFIAHLPGLSADKIDLVASAWKQAPGRDRAEARAWLCRAATPHERHRILAAASVARREAMDAACRRHRSDWAFWAAACEAAAAIAAGDRIGRHYDILTAPLAAVMPSLARNPDRLRHGRHLPESGPAVTASRSTRSRRMRSTLTPCRHGCQQRQLLVMGPAPGAVFPEIRTCRPGICGQSGRFPCRRSCRG